VVGHGEAPLGRTRGHHAARGECCLSTATIFRQPPIFRNLICPLATRLKSAAAKFLVKSSLAPHQVGDVWR